MTIYSFIFQLYQITRGDFLFVLKFHKTFDIKNFFVLLFVAINIIPARYKKIFFLDAKWINVFKAYH